MKSILYSVCIGSLALALTAWGQPDNNKRSNRARPQQRTASVHAARPANIGRTMSAQRHVSTTQYEHRGVTQRPGSNFVANRNARLQMMRERNFARNQAFRERTNTAVNRNRNMAVNRSRNTNEFRNRNEAAVNRERNLAMNSNTNERRSRSNVALNRQRNTVVNRTQNAAFYRRGNARITNNWHSNAFRGARYTAFRNYNRQWHDRSWWRSHYNRIVFVNGGWYYWNAGYWFPAWGYAPGVTFAFDGPIYGYNGLTPDQVTVNVQQQLAAAGYYDGPIDGVLGPMTREAIAAYQADNGLAVTSAIDEPTLATMGLV